MEKHNADLAKMLNGRELRFIIQTEDFPIVRRYTWVAAMMQFVTRKYYHVPTHAPTQGL